MEAHFRRLPINTVYLLQRAEKEPKWICEYFVTSQNNTLRDLVADFLINSILSYCCHCEEADYVKDEQILEFFEQFGSTFSKIIMHEQAAYHSHQLKQYFLVLNAVAKSSLLARYALNTSTQLTSKIIQCILLNRPSYTRSEISNRNTRTKINRNEVDLSVVFEFLGILIRSCRRNEGKLLMSNTDGSVPTSTTCEDDKCSRGVACTKLLPPTILPPDVEETLVPYYGENDCRIFENEEFIAMLVTENNAAARNIIVHLSFGCVAFSKLICNAIIDNAQAAPTTDLPQILVLARKVLLIDDNVQEYRVTSLLNSRTGLASIAMACKHLDTTRSYSIMRAIAKWTNGSDQTVHFVTKFLARDKDSLELIESWLHRYKNTTVSDQHDRVVQPPAPSAPSAGSKPVPLAHLSSESEKKKQNIPRTAAPFSP